MKTVNLIFWLVTCEALFKMAATSTTSALPICPRGYGWDVQLEDCLPYSICKTAPDTSICSDLPANDESEGRQTTENTHVCPLGYGWDAQLEDCLSFSVCDTAPDTAICSDPSRIVSKETRTLSHLGLAVGLATLVFAIVCVFITAAWCTTAQRTVIVKHGKCEEHLKKPIQVTSNAIQETTNGEISSERDPVLERVTVL